MQDKNVFIRNYLEQVLVDENNQAIGVEYEKFGEIKTALARKEVILSAGSVNTAKILMLSGIGPREHLESFSVSLSFNRK